MKRIWKIWPAGETANDYFKFNAADQFFGDSTIGHLMIKGQRQCYRFNWEVKQNKDDIADYSNPSDADKCHF